MELQTDAKFSLGKMNLYFNNKIDSLKVRGACFTLLSASMLRWDIAGSVLGVISLIGIILIATHDMDTRTVREIAQGEIKDLNVSKVVASYAQEMTRGPPGVFPSPFTQSVVFANGLVNLTDLPSVTQEQALVSFFNETVDQWTGEGISSQGDWWLRTSNGKLLVFNRYGHLGVGKVPTDALDVAGAASIEVLLSVGGPVTAQGAGTFGERLTVVTGGLDVGGDGGATITGNVSIINGDLRLGELSLRNLSAQVDFMQTSLQVLYGGEFRQDERFLALNTSVQHVATLLRAVNASVYGALDLIALSNSRVISVDVDSQGRDQQLGVRIDTLNATDEVQSQALSLLRTNLDTLRVNASVNFTILLQLNAIASERIARLIDNQTEFSTTQRLFNDSLLSLWQTVAQMNERETLDLSNVTALWQAVLRLQANVSSLDARQTLSEQELQVLEANISTLASQLLQLNVSFNASLYQQTVHHLALMNVVGLLGDDIQVLQNKVVALNLTDGTLSGRIDNVNASAQGLLGTVALLNANVQTAINTLTLADQLLQANISILYGWRTTDSGRIDSLNTTVSAQGNSLVLTQGNVQTLSNSLAALTTAHAGTLGRVAILESNVSSIAVQLLQLPRLDTLNASLITLTNAQGVTAANLQTLTNTVSVLNVAYLGTAAAVSVLQINVTTQASQLASINVQLLRLDVLNASLTTLSNTQAITNANLQTAIGTLNSLSTAYGITAAQVVVLQANVSTLFAQVLSVNASLWSLYALRSGDVLRIDSLNQTTITLTNMLGIANTNIQTLTTGQATLTTAMTTATNNIMLLNTSVTSLQVNLAALTTTVNGLSTTQSTLVTSVAGLQSQVNGLSLGSSSFVTPISVTLSSSLGSTVGSNVLVSSLQARSANNDTLETFLFRTNAGSAFDTASWRIQRVVDGDSATAYPFIEFTQTNVGIGRRPRYGTTTSTLTASGSAVVVTGTLTVSGASTFSSSARSTTVLGASGLGDVTGVTATWVAYDTANDRGYIYAALAGTGYKNLYLADASVSTTIAGVANLAGTVNVISAPTTQRGFGNLIIRDSGTSRSAIQLVETVDDYPLVQIMGYAHDNSGICFDCYYDGLDRNAHTSVAWRLFKLSGQMKFVYMNPGANPVGTSLSYSDLLVLSTGGVAVTGTLATSGTAAFSGDVSITGSNKLLWSTTGPAPLTFTTRSSGTRLVLYPSLSGTALDYSIGVDNSGYMWFTADLTTAGFKWYAGSLTPMATLVGGALTLTAGLSATTGTFSAALTANGGLSVAAAGVSRAGFTFSEPIAVPTGNVGHRIQTAYKPSSPYDNGVLYSVNYPWKTGTVDSISYGTISVNYITQQNGIGALIDFQLGGVNSAPSTVMTLNPSQVSLFQTLSATSATFTGDVTMSGTKIAWSQTGVAPPIPVNPTRSVGTKLVLYPIISTTNVEYAIGIDGSTMWFSVESDTRYFKWYGGTTAVATLTGAGALTLSSGIAATSASISSLLEAGTLRPTGSIGLPAGAGGSVYFTAGYASPTSGRIIFGDGSGWNLIFSSRTGGANTDRIIFSDTGTVTAAALSAASVSGTTATFTGSLAAGGGLPSGWSHNLYSVSGKPYLFNIGATVNALDAGTSGSMVGFQISAQFTSPVSATSTYISVQNVVPAFTMQANANSYKLGYWTPNVNVGTFTLSEYIGLFIQGGTFTIGSGGSVSYAYGARIENPVAGVNRIGLWTGSLSVGGGHFSAADANAGNAWIAGSLSAGGSLPGGYSHNLWSISGKPYVFHLGGTVNALDGVTYGTAIGRIIDCGFSNPAGATNTYFLIDRVTPGVTLGANANLFYGYSLNAYINTQTFVMQEYYGLRIEAGTWTLGSGGAVSYAASGRFDRPGAGAYRIGVMTSSLSVGGNWLTAADDASNMAIIQGPFTAGGGLAGGYSHSLYYLTGKANVLYVGGTVNVLDGSGGTTGTMTGASYYTNYVIPGGSTSAYVIHERNVNTVTLYSNTVQVRGINVYTTINTLTSQLDDYMGIWVEGGAANHGAGGSVQNAVSGRFENPNFGNNRVAIYAGSIVIGGGYSSAAQAAANSAIFNGPLIATSTIQGYSTLSLGSFIMHSTSGVNKPTFTTRSAGTRIVLYPQVSSDNVDYAIGIDGSTLWYSVPVFSASFLFRWYGGTSTAAYLDGTGAFVAYNTIQSNQAVGGIGTATTPGVKGTWIGYDTGSDYGLLFATQNGVTNKNLMIQQSGMTTLFGGPINVAGAATLSSTLGVAGLATAATFRPTGESGLPAGTSNLVYYTSGYSSPVAGRIIFGDGSGWQLNLARRASSVTTDVISFRDDGLMTVNKLVANGGDFNGLVRFIRSGLNLVISDNGSTGDVGTNAMLTVEGNTAMPIIKMTKPGVSSGYISMSSQGLVFNTDTVNAIRFRVGAPGSTASPEIAGSVQVSITTSGFFAHNSFQAEGAAYAYGTASANVRDASGGRSTTGVATTNTANSLRNFMTGMVYEWERSSCGPGGGDTRGWTGYNSGGGAQNGLSHYDTYFHTWTQWQIAGTNGYLEYVMTNGNLQTGVYWFEYRMYNDGSNPANIYSYVWSSCNGLTLMRRWGAPGYNGLTNHRDVYYAVTGCTYRFRLMGDTANQYIRVADLVITFMG